MLFVKRANCRGRRVSRDEHRVVRCNAVASCCNCGKLLVYTTPPVLIIAIHNQLMLHSPVTSLFGSVKRHKYACLTRQHQFYYLYATGDMCV